MTVMTGIFMSLAVCGAVMAVGLRNILHAIFGLALSLLAIAGLFLMLGSPFLAAMEILIYVGGITVAMIFAIMLSTVMAPEERSGLRHGLVLVATLLFATSVALAISQTTFPQRPSIPEDAWHVKRLGEGLLNSYNVAFEVLSVVLLLAIVGAIVISRRLREVSE
jgi:NADH:ubiquinone oxidoreductase subunit 6 (subunit J)